VARIVTVSEGATFRVQRIELTPDGTAMLTTNLDHGLPSRASRFRKDDKSRSEGLRPTKAP
jgi:hypothetical protein